MEGNYSVFIAVILIDAKSGLYLNTGFSKLATESGHSPTSLYCVYVHTPGNQPFLEGTSILFSGKRYLASSLGVG